MFQNKEFFDANENDTQFCSGSYAWLFDKNGNKTPVLILNGTGTIIQIWNGNCVTYCNIHDVKLFQRREHPFVQKLLNSSHKLFKEKQDAIEQVNKLKSKVQKIEDTNQGLINSALLFDDERIKWKQIDNHKRTYSPVLLVQNMKNKPIIVLDLWGNYHRVRRRSELVEFPSTSETKYILRHFDQLKRICARYVARLSQIKIGETHCLCQDKVKTSSAVTNNTVVCHGTIMHFVGVNKSKYTAAVKRSDNGTYMYLTSDQIRIIKDRIPGHNHREKQLQNLEEFTSYLEHTNSKLLLQKRQQRQALEAIQKEKKLIDDQNKRLNDRIRLLEDERKAFETNINRLKEENEKLKLLNINTDNYEQWDVDEIVHWIISLNPKIYGQYEEILYKSLTEEQVDGGCMNDIEVSDIIRWGIVNFKHSKGFMKHIKLLIENKKNKNNQNEIYQNIYTERVNSPTAYTPH